MAPNDAVRDLKLALLLIAQLSETPAQAPGELARRLGIDEDELGRLVTLVTMCGLPPYSPDELLEIEIDARHVELKSGPASALAAPARLTLAETEALSAALMLVGNRLGDDHAHPLTSLVEKVRASLASASDPLDASTAPATERTLGAAPGPEDSTILAALWRAASQGRRVRIEYYAASSDSSSVRQIDPFGIRNFGGVWYVAAYCHQAQEERLFRVDRVRSAISTGERFETASDPRLERWAAAPFSPSVDTLEAVVRFRGDAARRAVEAWPECAREARPSKNRPTVAKDSATGAAARQSPAEGTPASTDVVITIPYRQEGWMVRELLPYLDGAMIESPPTLQAAYAAVVTELCNRYR